MPLSRDPRGFCDTFPRHNTSKRMTTDQPPPIDIDTLKSILHNSRFFYGLRHCALEVILPQIRKSRNCTRQLMLEQRLPNYLLALVFPHSSLPGIVRLNLWIRSHKIDLSSSIEAPTGLARYVVFAKAQSTVAYAEAVDAAMRWCARPFHALPDGF